MSVPALSVPNCLNRVTTASVYEELMLIDLVRYVFLLFSQPDGFDTETMVDSSTSRTNFNLSAFAADVGLGNPVGGTFILVGPDTSDATIPASNATTTNIAKGRSRRSEYLIVLISSCADEASFRVHEETTGQETIDGIQVLNMRCIVLSCGHGLECMDVLVCVFL